MKDILYIDGVKHRVDIKGFSFYADHPDHPGVPCSHHWIGADMKVLLAGAVAIRTGGHTYSLHPPKDKACHPPSEQTSTDATPATAAIAAPTTSRTGKVAELVRRVRAATTILLYGKV